MKQAFLTIAIAAVVSYSMVSFAGSSSTSVTAQKESVYDRVMRTGTIRCGYYLAEPYTMKDLKTGQLSGIWYDYVEALGKELNLKIDWAEEVGLGDYSTALEFNRIDAMCLGVWVDPTRARAADFVTPISYHGAYIWVRTDDRRFDQDLKKLNDPGVTISYTDGDIGETVRAEDFPLAQAHALPQLVPVPQVLEDIVAKKADFVVMTPEVVAGFNRANGDQLRKIGKPIRIFQESIAVRRDAHEFRRLLDHTTRFLIGNRVIDKIFHKYEAAPESFLRTAVPYQTP
jgi:ABC-type amino acid transport substrate-binding protein